MMKTLLWAVILMSLLGSNLHLAAHCQMPCGIYHDDMVFEIIDQYVETMHKGLSVLGKGKFVTTHDRNELIRWVMLKDKESDKTAELILTYFLQQKIKPGETDTVKKLESAHRLLFLLVAIKQHTDLQMVKDFAIEWDKFKAMFHIEGYECEMEKIRIKDWEKNKEKQEQLSKKEAAQKSPKDKEITDHQSDSVDNDDRYYFFPVSHPHSQIRDVRVRENEEAASY